MSLLDMHNTNKKTQKAQKTITKHKSQNSQKTKHTRKPLQAKHGLCKGFYVKLPPARSEGPRRRTPTHPPLNPYGLPHYALNLPNALGTMSMPFLPK